MGSETTHIRVKKNIYMVERKIERTHSTSFFDREREKMRTFLRDGCFFLKSVSSLRVPLTASEGNEAMDDEKAVEETVGVSSIS